jgi:type I restriction enzyme S subunit
LYENVFLNFETQHGIPLIIDNSQKIDKKDYLKDGDIVLADASEDYEGVGEVVEVLNIDSKIAVGGLHTIVLRGNHNLVATGFRGYLFSSESVRNTMRKMANGTSVYSVTKTTLNNLVFDIPESTKEQTAIAQVLQAADKEIQLLKDKTIKLKEKKKGLMQQLLTGKKRLKVKE